MVLLSGPSLLLGFPSPWVFSPPPSSSDTQGSKDSAQEGSCSTERFPSQKQSSDRKSSKVN